MSNSKEDEKSLIFDKVLSIIKEGKTGTNRGLSSIFRNKLLEVIPNIQKGMYYLIGAESGVGKTTFADEAFIHQPFKDYQKRLSEGEDIALVYVYFSYEISKEEKIAKAICRKLFEDHKILYDTNYILSKGSQRILEEDIEKIENCRSYFEELEKHFYLFDIPETPQRVEDKILEVLRKYGSFKESSTKLDIKEKTFEFYKETYFIVIFDHAELVIQDSGHLSTKMKIDDLSRRFVKLRNLYNLIIVNIQQFNRNQNDSSRKDDIRPRREDFKDSGNTYQDANVVMALFDPSIYKVSNYMGYEVHRFKNMLRTLHVLKNRSGTSNVNAGFILLFGTGSFYQIPPSEDFISRSGQFNEDLYKKYFGKMLNSFPNKQEK